MPQVSVGDPRGDSGVAPRDTEPRPKSPRSDDRWPGRVAFNGI